MRTPTAPPPRIGNVELRGMRSTLMRQTLRLSRMQRFVDAAGDRLIRGISVNSASDAGAAATTYDEAWFRRSLYSQSVRARLARTLIEATRDYPFVDTSVWHKVTGDK